MSFVKRIFSHLFLCAFACVFFAHNAFGATAVFSVTTTNLSAGDTFQFKISASGTFSVDCGGGTLSGTGVSGGTIINRQNTTTNDTYTCTYSSEGVKTISFYDGYSATGYSTSTVAAISFYNNTYVKELGGDLSVVFPEINGQYPKFYHSFSGCTNLTTIPGTLFAGITTGADYMFAFTFYGCTGLTELPENLFSNITTSAAYMFSYTFAQCTGLQSIPEGLFDGITTGAENMFSNTFLKCSGLKYLPDGLFSKITTPASQMFMETFRECSNLGRNSDPAKNFIPPTFFKGLVDNGSPGASQIMHFMFYQSNLRTQCPENYYKYTTGYESDWNNKVSCKQCPNGKVSPEGSTNINQCARRDYVFSLNTTVLNANDEFKFLIAAKGTFFIDCGKDGVLTSSANDLAVLTDGGYRVIRTYANNATTYTCTYSTGGPKTIQFGGEATEYSNFAAIRFNIGDSNNANVKKIASISGSLGQIFGTVANLPASSGQPKFLETFHDATNMTGTIPPTLFDGVSGAPAINMFNSTFSGCSGLTGFGDKTYVPGDFLENIDTNTSISYQAYDMFSGTQLANSCPAGTYDSTRTQFNDAGKPWCAECPTGTTSLAGATDVSQCDQTITPSNPTTYTVTYHNVSNSTWANTYAYGVGASVGVPSRTGYTFLGWCVNNSNCSNYANNVTGYTISTTDTGDVDLYAMWDCDTANGYSWNSNHECVASQYTVTYNCGYYNGTPPAQQPVSDSVSFTPAADAPNCGQMSGATLTGWVVSGTNDIKTPGTAFSYEYDEDKTFTAVWSCYPNIDNTDCIAGYQITLTVSSVPGFPQPETPAVPNIIYTIPTRGAYLDMARTKLMTSDDNSVIFPARPWTTSYDTNAPINRETGNLYDIASVSDSEYGYFYYCFMKVDNVCRIGVKAGNTIGYITSQGIDDAENIYDNQNWYITAGGVNGDGIKPVPNLTGYICEGWYDASSGGTRVNSFGMTVHPETLYAHWTPKTYNVVYNKGAHATSGSADYTDTNGATYDSPYTPLSFSSTPISNSMSADTGYVFVGWTTNSTPTFTNGVLNNQYTGDTWWKRDSGLTLYAAYDCANGYSWNSNHECVLTSETSTVNLKWFVKGQEYNLNQSSCEYGTGTINNIQHQEFPGLTFIGWKVTDWYRLLDTVTSNFSGWCNYGRFASGSSGFSSGCGSLNSVATDNTWGLYATSNAASEHIIGTAICSDQSTTLYATGNPGTSNGQYCWCQILSYTNSDGVTEQYNDLPWVYVYDYSTSSNGCGQMPAAYNCLRQCAVTLVNGNTTFRTALFGQ